MWLTVVFKKKVPRMFDVGPTNHRHCQLFGRGEVRDCFSFAGEATAQRKTLSGFLEHGVCVTGMPFRRAASGRPRMREVDESDVESLAWERAKSPRCNVRPAPRLWRHHARDDSFRSRRRWQRVKSGLWDSCPTSSTSSWYHCTTHIKRKGKVNVDFYSACREHTSKALRYGTRSQGISHFHLHTPRSSANGMNHTCLCLPSRSWYSFTDPGGMEGWVVERSGDVL